MTEWYNMKLSSGETLEFQPKSIDGQYRFQIWNNKDKKYINQGEFIVTEAGKQEVNAQIKLTEEELKIYNKSHKFIRDVIINGEEKRITLAVTAERALKGEIDIIKQLGEEPLKYTYILRKEGEGLRTQYFLSRGKSVGLRADAKPSTPSVNLDLKTGLILTVDEQAYVDALKDTTSNPQVAKYTKQDKIDLLVQKLKITVDRSTKIIGENF